METESENYKSNEKLTTSQTDEQKRLLQKSDGKIFIKHGIKTTDLQSD